MAVIGAPVEDTREEARHLVPAHRLRGRVRARAGALHDVELRELVDAVSVRVAADVVKALEHDIVMDRLQPLPEGTTLEPSDPGDSGIPVVFWSDDHGQRLHRPG